MHFGIDCSPSSIECLPLEEVSASEWPAVLNAFTVLHQPPPTPSLTKQTAAPRWKLFGKRCQQRFLQLVHFPCDDFLEVATCCRKPNDPKAGKC